MSRAFRYYYLKVVRQRGAPEQIAGGVVIGVFLGMVGPPGLQMIIAFGVAALLNCNRIAAALSVWLTNPITMPFIYSAQLTVGSLITGIPVRDIVPTSREEFWAFVTNYRAHGRAILVMFVGATIVGGISAAASYYPAKAAVIAYRRRKEEVRQRRRLKAQGLLDPAQPLPPPVIRQSNPDAASEHQDERSE